MVANSMLHSENRVVVQKNHNNPYSEEKHNNPRDKKAYSLIVKDTINGNSYQLQVFYANLNKFLFPLLWNIKYSKRWHNVKYFILRTFWHRSTGAFYKLLVAVIKKILYPVRHCWIKGFKSTALLMLLKYHVIT